LRAVRRRRLVLVLVAVPLALVGTGDAGAIFQSSGPQASLASVPRAEVALVLGGSAKSGPAASALLDERIASAAELYRAGKVDSLLVSGNHERAEYDEVGTMRKALLAYGVPAEDVFSDDAGVDAWDRAQRARAVFGLRSVVVVTQSSQMNRALLAMKDAGLRATGYSADRRAFRGVAPGTRRGSAFVPMDIVT
jgi:vancomycin permeability regulator SanA